ncbi:glycosyl transferase family 1, partial [Actinoplanes sp. NPDC051633]|uniref:glycosyl transferase family 1 n=1 Tax=Actinoplanes sp. NPDC051633 TaxID=3155670 RepID=UPI0034231496
MRKAGKAIKYGFLSTSSPTRCGLATFNSALAAHLDDGTGGNGIVRVTVAHDDQRPAPGVVHTWQSGAHAGRREAAAALNAFDVAVVQHDYGIYPGQDGAEIVPLLRRLAVPSIVVLHTVLSNPTASQKSLLEAIVATASAVVTMTGTARDRLLIGYAADPAKVSVIPHGADDHAGVPVTRADQPHLLTWGLLGPGKGIEWALRAFAMLQDLDPAPTYTVAGRTHPKVVERDGEAYRAALHRLGATLGVGHAVTYRPEFLDAAALGGLIRSADVVILPYDSREQVTSGVLSEAVA